MSTGVKLLNTIVIIISVGLYWASQALVGTLLHQPQQLVVLNQEWSYTVIFFITIIQVFFLVMI